MVCRLGSSWRTWDVYPGSRTSHEVATGAEPGRIPGMVKSPSTECQRAETKTRSIHALAGVVIR